MTLHLIGLPWTETTRAYSVCAYTQKLVKFGDMMTGRARRVVLYAGADNEALCDDFVPLITDGERIEWFGAWDPVSSLTRVTWDPAHPSWATMNDRAIAALRERLQPQDLILLTAGRCQRAIADAFPNHISVEWAVGYEGIFAKYCAFESSAWMHHVYGLEGWRLGRFYDAVIPNFFDASDFHVEPKDDYLLYIGRLTHRKGPHVAAQLAAACGRTLLVAGSGATSVTQTAAGTRIEADQVVIEGPHVQYVGPVGPEGRAILMARAAAVLVPTLYVEPFGGVAVEAMLSGSPVVSTDFGAFTETVEPGITGYRFATFAEGVQAVEQALTLDPARIRAHALAKYSLSAVAPRFEQWFDRLDGIWGEGWTALPAGKSQGIQYGSGVNSSPQKDAHATLSVLRHFEADHAVH